MNKYLIKISQSMNDKSTMTPGPTAIHETLASIPADIAGVGLGGIVGRKYGLLAGEHNLGSMAGAAIGGLATNYAVLKHQQLQQKGLIQ